MKPNFINLFAIDQKLTNTGTVSCPRKMSLHRTFSPNQSQTQLGSSLKKSNPYSIIFNAAKGINEEFKKSHNEGEEQNLSPSLADDAFLEIHRSTKWITNERKVAAEKINSALQLRKKYQCVEVPKLINSIDHRYLTKEGISVFPVHYSDGIVPIELPKNDTTIYYEQKDGVFLVKLKENQENIFTPITLTEFIEDYKEILRIIDSGPAKTFSMERMQEMHHQFELHKIFSFEKTNTGKDFFSAGKVDTHIHADSCFTEKELFRYIKSKYENKEIVHEIINKEGKKEKETLKDMCKRKDININKLTLHKIGVKIYNYDRYKEDDLRTVFLNINNIMEGEYFADLVKTEMKHLEITNCYFELRLSINGKNENEWNLLAQWAKKWNVNSTHNKWIIQFPKRFVEIKGDNTLFTYSNFLSNLFKPLFEVSQNPQNNEILANFLEKVSGFDLVGDENEIEQIIGSDTFNPTNWNKSVNPSYFIYMYYLYANIVSLNIYRMSRGLSTFDFRPHCGETGHYSHLAAAFLTVKGISHGIKLTDSPTLKYLYLLTQIGITMSPMANHLTQCQYNQNPFNNFFKRGLNVTLSSDEPLQIHRTQEPLMEEFAMAQQTWKFEDVDLVEMCNNSIKQSGFSLMKKTTLFGNKNDVMINGRSLFRNKLLDTEFAIIKALITDNSNKIFGDIPATTIDLNYKTKDPKEIDVMKKITYWMLVREKYFAENLPQVINDSIQLNNPTTPQLFCAMSNGIYNIYNTPDAICDIDHYHNAFVYCFDCRKNYCKHCFKEAHKDQYHSIRRTKHLSYYPIIEFSEYINDYNDLVRFSTDGPSRTFCYKQLHSREQLFILHKILNNSLESQEIKKLPIDFERSTKVDTVVAASRSFHPRDLLMLIWDKLKEDGDRVVFPEISIKTESGTRVYKHVTLRNAFSIYQIKDFSLDNLSVTFDPSLIQRYDLWDSRNTIFNVKELRDLFLTTTNSVGGTYFCEFLKKTRFDQVEEQPNQKTEMHMCLYGRRMNEIEDIAKVIVKNGLICPEKNNFSIQLPRKYAMIKKEGNVNTFEELLRHMFEPLFDATLNPEKHPELVTFLENVGAFDCKGDESEFEGKISLSSLPVPAKWDSYKEPPFAYWIYYVYTNIHVLNNLRRTLKMNTFDFKPHCGETGDPMHNAAAFLTADAISHGITLDKQNTLQYLFILAQIGISCCPIYDKFLYDIIEHPFYKYFMRGMLVTLATDSPMHTHTTKEPLVEEYASAIKIFKLTASDIAEIAQNSLLISSFSEDTKQNCLTTEEGESSSVPQTRLQFRAKISKLDFDTLLKFNIGRSNLTEKEQDIILQASMHL
ncbi:hypothetical protein ENUP19_0089G0040 [Entamoeba nuttalli]|uniref:AMP deaminase, putative n=2 Tax=Entamoeba nuttalli TaxID=412467 RepID=K2GZ62_ENTNP|nr:AMP deaminase, putative [Entamoeba nuttalli P19]EKE39142.1 AMP deaminase, putative [Entamoeba nuttalli P19]|eukprot:XP_008858523.1 AMP deaminase, putative [Entamoeba nuttalli P19]